MGGFALEDQDENEEDEIKSLRKTISAGFKNFQKNRKEGRWCEPSIWDDFWCDNLIV